MPGIGESIRRPDDDCSVLGEQGKARDYELWPEWEERLAVLVGQFQDGDDYIVEEPRSDSLRRSTQ